MTSVSIMALSRSRRAGVAPRWDAINCSAGKATSLIGSDHTKRIYQRCLHRAWASIRCRSSLGIQCHWSFKPSWLGTAAKRDGKFGSLFSVFCRPLCQLLCSELTHSVTHRCSVQIVFVWLLLRRSVQTAGAACLSQGRGPPVAGAWPAGRRGVARDFQSQARTAARLDIIWNINHWASVLT